MFVRNAEEFFFFFSFETSCKCCLELFEFIKRNLIEALRNFTCATARGKGEVRKAIVK